MSSSPKVPRQFWQLFHLFAKGLLGIIDRSAPGGIERLCSRFCTIYLFIAIESRQYCKAKPPLTFVNSVKSTLEAMICQTAGIL